MIAIGSKAMLAQLPKTVENDRRFLASDYDVIMTYDEFEKWRKGNGQVIEKLYPTEGNKFKAVIYKNWTRKQYEIEIAFPGTSAAFLIEHANEVTNGTVKGFIDETFQTLSLSYLMLTKRSHLIYPVHFEKNINDYHILKDKLGEFKQDETMKEYYILRSEEAKNRYKQRTPKLNVSNEDFFSSKLNVPSYFVHDDIHEVMKHHEQPVYEMMKHDFDSAWCEKDMFFELPYNMQVQAVQEEAYTIALERYIIPKYGYEWKDHYLCYQKAVKRICTTLCSGWFREFAIENYPSVMEFYNKDFVKKFEEAFKNGEIKTKKDMVWKP